MRYKKPTFFFSVLSRLYGSSVFAGSLGVLFLAGATEAQAQLTSIGNYESSQVFSISDERLAAFDYGADGNLYYMTSSASYMGATLWQWDGSSSAQLYTESMHFAGAGVTAVGEHIYFNDSDFSNNQYIYSYNTSTGDTPAEVSSNFNYGLYSGGTSYANTLWVTGAQQPTYSNEILYAETDSSGGLTGEFVSIAQPGGASGPMAFDTEGNLYYASGYSTEIFAWSAEQVVEAMLNPVDSFLDTENALLSYDYGSDFDSVAGATGMAFDENGILYITLTNFSAASVVGLFDFDDFTLEDSYLVAESTGRLGDILYYDGQILVGAADGIYALQAVPEPSVIAYIGFVLLLAILFRRRLPALRS